MSYQSEAPRRTYIEMPMDERAMELEVDFQAHRKAMMERIDEATARRSQLTQQEGARMRQFAQQPLFDLIELTPVDEGEVNHQ